MDTARRVTTLCSQQSELTRVLQDLDMGGFQLKLVRPLPGENRYEYIKPCRELDELLVQLQEQLSSKVSNRIKEIGQELKAM